MQARLPKGHCGAFARQVGMDGFIVGVFLCSSNMLFIVIFTPCIILNTTFKMIFFFILKLSIVYFCSKI